MLATKRSTSQIGPSRLQGLVPEIYLFWLLMSATDDICALIDMPSLTLNLSQTGRSDIVNMILQRFFSPLSKPAQTGLTGMPLADIKQALRQVLDGCNGTRTQRLHFKIDIAKKPTDLWGLRSDLHQCIAQVHTESVAAQRINNMVCLFEGWVPAAQLTKIQPGFRPSQN